MIYNYVDNGDSPSDIISVHLWVLYYAVNLTITIVGIFSASKLVKQIGSYCNEESNSITRKKVINAAYWSTVLVCGITNTYCLGWWLTLISGSLSNLYYYYDYYYNIQASIPLALTSAVYIVEFVSILIIVKDFKLRNSTCCCTKGCIVRVIHTLAICNILWFLHRVGCGLLVAIFFIALAPAQTLAAISMIFLVIIYTIIYVAYNIYYIGKMKCCTKESWKTAGELFVLFVFYLCIVSTLVCLTILFNELAVNGLTSSGLGSVVLSLVAPTVVFIITLQLKQYFKKFFIPAQNNVINNVINNEEYDRLLA